MVLRLPILLRGIFDRPEIRDQTELTHSTDKPLHDTLHKKISTSATQNTPNRHLIIVTILKPTYAPPESRTRRCLPERHPYTSAARGAGRTLPCILSQNPVEDFGENGTKSRLPAIPRTPPWPTLAATAYPANAWMPPCNSSCPWAQSAANPSARTVPTVFGRQPMQTSTDRVTYHAYHAYHAPFPSAGSHGFRGHGDNKVTETAESLSNCF